MQRPAESVAGLANKLRCFAPESARLTRTLFNSRMQALAGRAGINMQPAPSTFGRRSCIHLQLKAPSGELGVFLDTRQHPEIVVAVSAEEEPLRNALAALLLSRQLNELSSITGHSFSVAGISGGGHAKLPQTTLPANGVDISVRIENGRAVTEREEILVTLTPPTRSLAQALEARLGQVIPDLPRSLQTLALSGCAVLGQHSFSMHLLKSLRPGDVLLNCLPAGASTSEIPDVVIYWGHPRGRRLQARGHLNKRTITIEENPIMSLDTVDSMSRGQSEFEGGSIPIAEMQALEVPVRLELDTIAMPLGHLSSLMPGYVLELPVPATDTQIRLVSYGQTLGYGQLVVVGENLGLQIVKMSGHDVLSHETSAAHPDKASTGRTGS